MSHVLLGVYRKHTAEASWRMASYILDSPVDAELTSTRQGNTQNLPKMNKSSTKV